MNVAKFAVSRQARMQRNYLTALGALATVRRLLPRDLDPISGAAASGALPTLEQRKAEDDLAKSVYSEVPATERELLALVHTMLNTGLVAEADIARRMHTVRSRLEAA